MTIEAQKLLDLISAQFDAKLSVFEGQPTTPITLERMRETIQESVRSMIGEVKVECRPGESEDSICITLSAPKDSPMAEQLKKVFGAK
jgi:hypothetical protein